MGRATKYSFKWRKSILPWWQPYVFILPFFALYFTFKLYPVIYSFFVSLTEWDGITERTFVGLENYKKLLTDARFHTSVKNTLFFTVIPLPILVIFGLILSVLMTSPYMRARRVFQTIYFMPYITSPVAVGFIFAFIFDIRVGFVNRALMALGLIEEEIFWLGIGKLARIVVVILLIWKYMGFYMVLMISGITNISPELYDAAYVDGANQVQCFFKITLPLMRNILTFVIIQGLIGSFQLAEDPMVLFTGMVTGGSGVVVGGPERSALTMIWYMFDVGFGTTMRYGYASAVSFAIFVLIAVFSIVFFILLNRKEESV